MELAPILIAIFAFVLIKNYNEQQARERARKLDLLEEAIKGGNLDREMVEDLSATLSGRKPPRRPTGNQTQAPPRPRGTWFLGLGWIGIFVGLGIAGLGGFNNEEGVIGCGLLVTLISFGVTTYPFALRELDARRRA